MNILLLASHAVAEFDDLRMLSDIGYDVFSPGGYADPRHPGDDLRPALDLPYHADLDALCHAQRVKHEGEDLRWPIDHAKNDLHPDLIEWADTIIVHHFPERWIAGQWERLQGKRVIWRTCGQSNPVLEADMARLRRVGMQIVRYSPAEGALGATYAGADATIRFGKYPSDWGGWTGAIPRVGNLTQDMVGRAEFCGLSFYRDATHDVSAMPAGRNSDLLPGGIGALGYEQMRDYLRGIRAYVYTGTQPASYTLGLIEAMMTGVPVVSIGSRWMWNPDLFEEDLALRHTDDPVQARTWLEELLQEPALGEAARTRQRAVDLFGIGAIKSRWATFLGGNPIPRGDPLLLLAVPA